ncbi:HNH endonuclease signature motif containing protein [Burkholderia gladioli]|uniref:HNH endonuclease signature motif containing protein n=1 Tax=Burkholderia gladioli TaxID=28095 RepID=UPI001642271F|nr:HNH endonuclease signature motif containing protein [Burkholderia gladioli]MBU9426446.1 HNH endonuclease [Burkholderia gladioli]MDN8063407.1 HNH endonuclease signature motif containing protein [Burkholderia gladioli]
MSKKQARSPASYENEEMALALVPAVLSACGFTSVIIRKRGQVKLVEAITATGEAICFWLKQGWTGERRFSAVQFGLFVGEDDKDIPNERFLQYVDTRVARVKSLGATHALFIHMAGELIRNWVALKIDDVSVAYHQQMAGWPQRARNTKSATLWFEDERTVEGADCVQAVSELEISLSALAAPFSAAGEEPVEKDADAGPASMKMTTEVERRMRQAAFRQRLGRYFGWRCAVSGITVRAALEAAHLPGKNWRFDNRDSDGILLRADLHRMLDAGIARIEDDRFMLDAAARIGDYARLHGVALQLKATADK